MLVPSPATDPTPEPTPTSQASDTPPAAAGLPASGQGDPPAGSAGGDKPARPEKLPEQFWDADAGAIKLDDLAGRLAELEEVARLDGERKAQIPKAPGEYTLDLPADLKLPEGYAWKVNKDDPVLQEFQKIAHEAGMTNADFQRLSGTYAKALSSQIAAQDAVLAAEFKSLGDRAAERVGAVTNAIGAQFGAETLKRLTPVFDTVGAGALVEVFEALLEGRLKSSGSPTSANGGSSGSGISSEQWAAMTPEQKIEFNRRAAGAK